MLVGIEREHRLHERALGRAFLARQLMGPHAVDLAAVREEQQVRMGSRVEHVVDDVVLAQTCTLDPASTPSLGAIGAGQHGLDVAGGGDRHDQLLVGDEILERHFAFVGDDATPAGVPVLLLDRLQLGGDDLPLKRIGGKDGLELRDRLL